MFIHTAIASDRLEIGIVQNSVLDLLPTKTTASVFGSLPCGYCEFAKHNCGFNAEL